MTYCSYVTSFHVPSLVEEKEPIPQLLSKITKQTQDTETTKFYFLLQVQDLFFELVLSNSSSSKEYLKIIFHTLWECLSILNVHDESILETESLSFSFVFQSHCIQTITSCFTIYYQQPEHDNHVLLFSLCQQYISYLQSYTKTSSNRIVRQAIYSSLLVLVDFFSLAPLLPTQSIASLASISSMEYSHCFQLSLLLLLQLHNNSSNIIYFLEQCGYCNEWIRMYLMQLLLQKNYPSSGMEYSMIISHSILWLQFCNKWLQQQQSNNNNTTEWQHKELVTYWNQKIQNSWNGIVYGNGALFIFCLATQWTRESGTTPFALFPNTLDPFWIKQIKLVTVSKLFCNFYFDLIVSLYPSSSLVTPYRLLYYIIPWLHKMIPSQPNKVKQYLKQNLLLQQDSIMQKNIAIEFIKQYQWKEFANQIFVEQCFDFFLLFELLKTRMISKENSIHCIAWLEEMNWNMKQIPIVLQIISELLAQQFAMEKVLESLEWFFEDVLTSGKLTIEQIEKVLDWKERIELYKQKHFIVGKQVVPVSSIWTNPLTSPLSTISFTVLQIVANEKKTTLEEYLKQKQTSFLITISIQSDTQLFGLEINWQVPSFVNSIQTICIPYLSPDISHQFFIVFETLKPLPCSLDASLLYQTNSSTTLSQQIHKAITIDLKQLFVSIEPMSLRGQVWDWMMKSKQDRVVKVIKELPFSKVKQWIQTHWSSFAIVEEEQKTYKVIMALPPQYHLCFELEEYASPRVEEAAFTKVTIVTDYWGIYSHVDELLQ